MKQKTFFGNNPYSEVQKGFRFIAGHKARKSFWEQSIFRSSKGFRFMAGHKAIMPITFQQ
jgi:hypothetical protein